MPEVMPHVRQFVIDLILKHYTNTTEDWLANVVTCQDLKVNRSILGAV